jgi:hypothetical protein
MPSPDLGLIPRRTAYEPTMMRPRSWIMMDEDGSLWDALADQPIEEGEEPPNREDHVGPRPH